MRKFDQIVRVTPDGKIPEPFARIIREFFQENAGGRARIRLDRKTKIRSLAQNAYYHGVIVSSFIQAAEEEWGKKFSHDQAHEILKVNCLFEEKVNEQTGEIIRIPGSTTENDTFDQEAYHDRCRRLISDYFNFTVPLPNEQGTIDYTENG